MTVRGSRGARSTFDLLTIGMSVPWVRADVRMPHSVVEAGVYDTRRDEGE